jgi:putative ABC transport system permease protein
MVHILSVVLIPDMLKNYFTIALRNLFKHTLFTVINISGLTAGIACVMVIVLYIGDELSYDRFHKQSDRIFRVVQEHSFTDATQQLATTSGPVAGALMQDFPEVQKAVRILLRKNVVLTFADKQFDGEHMALTDAEVFDVFSFTIVQGNPQEALRQPYSLVLTEATAAKYFGKEEAMGKRLKVNGTDYTVRGVIKNIPQQSHVHFTFLASISTIASAEWMNNWGITSLWTYVLLKQNTDVEALRHKLSVFTEKYHGPEYVTKIKYHLQPLTQIHLHSNMAAEIEPNGDIQYVRIFGAVAIAVLLLACINYVGMATAMVSKRMREVGLRKTLGAHRWQVSLQFFAESFILTLAATAMAVVVVLLCLPVFNQFANKQLSLASLTYTHLLFWVVIFICISVGSGAYPAWYLSKFEPTQVLRGNIFLGGGRKLRKLLVVIQFTFSIIILVISMITYHQLDFIRNSHLGFKKENLIHIKVRNRAQWKGKTDLLKQAFLKIPSVTAAAASLNFIGEELDGSDVRRAHAGADENRLLSIAAVDYDFIETMQLQVVAGRAFSRHFSTDTSAAFIINEAAMRKFGWRTAQEAIGQELVYLGGGRTTEPIIGVVKDFHFASLHQQVQPLLMICWPSMLSSINVRIKPGNTSETLAAIENTWKKVSPDFPLEYEFAEEALDKLYRQDEKAGTLFSIITYMAISIACIGLFGMASFSASRRIREIAVRKVLGASTYAILWLLVHEFLGLVLLAMLIASPIAYYSVNVWLQNFAYQVPVTLITFIEAGMIVTLVALFTVSYQSIKAALANPVKSLRSE